MTDRTRGRSPAAERPPEQSTCGVFGLQALEGRVLLSSTGATPWPLAEAPPAPVVAAAAASPGGLTVADRRALIARLTPGELSASLSKTLRHSGPDAFDASLLKYMERRAGPKFFFNGRQLTRIFADSTFRSRADLTQAIERADAVLAHRFPEQLSATEYDVQLPEEIDWDTQPATTDNPDFLHGLNRQMFWKDLAIAYRYTGDGKYVRELVSQLSSWSAQTAPLADPNDWASSSPHWWLLDAADRAGNWTYAYFMVLGSADWTPAANTLFLSEIWEHGDFLSRVTPSGYAKNRTALHAAGLQRLGMLFPEFTDAPTWEYDGTDMSFRCLAAQFFPDGGHVEETPYYALSVLNSMFESVELADLNGLTLWTKNRRRLLQRGVEADYQLIAASGQLPALSDTYRSSTIGRFFTRAAILFRDTRYNVVGPLALEDLIMAGGDIGNILPTSGDLGQRQLTYALPDTGYYVMRGGTGQQVVFDAGPKGGTHGHYDLLSFELDSALPLIPDPGPYIYDDSPERQWAISTPAHNTISIDGLNHQDLEGAHNPKIVVDEFTSGTNESRITAHHYAYDGLSGAPAVGRTLWMDQTHDTLPVVVVVDWARSGGGHDHTFTSSLTLSPTGDVTQNAPGDLDLAVTRTHRMRVQTLLLPGQTTDLTDTVITNEPPPDDKTPAKRYAVSQTGTSALFVTLISEYIPGGFNPTQPASIAFDAPPRKGQPVHLRLTMPDGTVRLLDFAPPDLDPLPTALAASAAPIPSTPFSTTPIHSNPCLTKSILSLEPARDADYTVDVAAAL